MLYWFPLNPSKSKYQVVHEQKFKDLLSSTCQICVERIVLDLESEVMRGLSSIPTAGNILPLEFFCFHAVKTKMPISGISLRMWKKPITHVQRHMQYHIALVRVICLVLQLFVHVHSPQQERRYIERYISYKYNFLNNFNLFYETVLKF